MKIKKYLKKFFSILILSFFIFTSTGSLVFALDASKFPIKIHLGKFSYKTPSPVVTNTSKDAGTNYDPHYALKDPEKGATKIVDYGGESGDSALVTTVEQGEAIVFPRINGLTIIRLSYLKLINDSKTMGTAFSAPAVFSTYILSLVTDQNIIKDYYVAVPSSYQQFQLLNKGVSSLFSVLKTLGLAEESPIDFYAGVSYVKPDTNDEIRNKMIMEIQAWLPSFGSSMSSASSNFHNDTITKIKSDFKITGDIKTPVFISPEQKKLLDGQSALYASGACYQVLPTGQKNICINTIKQRCDTKTNTYFLHGISCEQLNTLFVFPENSAAINAESQVAKEIIANAKLKDKTIFKPQVSFGGITEGISLPDYMNLMYKYLMSFALVITGFVLVIGGVKYMIGQNDGIPMIKNAFIGVILLSGTYVILKTVNPAAVNMNIIEISDISRKTIEAQNQSEFSTSLKKAAIIANCGSMPAPNSALPSDIVLNESGQKAYKNDYYTTKKGFNPNCVLSDKALQFDSSYGADKIQKLFEDKNSILALLEYNGKKASQIIYEQAQKLNVSPQIILTKLQKEQALISSYSLQKMFGDNITKLSQVTDTMIQSLSTSTNSKIRLTIDFATGYQARDGEYRLLYKTASEIDTMFKSSQSPAEKELIKFATGVLELYKIDFTKMTPGERYVRARMETYNHSAVGEGFGQLSYSPDLTAAKIFGGFEKQIYQTAKAFSVCGKSGGMVPLDYVGHPNNQTAIKANSSLPSEVNFTHNIQQVCFGNRITSCLYSYTPHVSAQLSVIGVWRYLGFDSSYIFPKDECAALPAEWLQIGQ